MAREDLHFRLRIPGDLKNRIERAAVSNRRSMTAEIVARLEISFDDRITTSPDELKALIREAVDEAIAQQNSHKR